LAPGVLLLNKTLEMYSGHQRIKYISFITGARWNDDWAPLVNKVYKHSIYQLTPAGLYGYTFESLKGLLCKVKRRYYSGNGLLSKRNGVMAGSGARQAKSASQSHAWENKVTTRIRASPGNGASTG